MLGMIDAALHRTRTVVLILLLLLVAGYMSYQSIPKEAEPDITIPFIYVSISHSGISPEDAERLLLRPMEKELRGIDGVKEMTSTASEGHGSVLLEFVAGADTSSALADVREKVSLAKAKLPDGTDEPTVNEVTMASENPAITVMLSGTAPERALITIARDLKDKLESMREVLEVDIGGDREDMIEILVDPLLMESYDLDQQDIYNLISRNNRLVAAGTLDSGQGRFPIKLPSVFDNIKDVMEMPVKVSGDKVITFGDVATVRRTFQDAESYARVNGKPAVSLEVKKRPGENIIQTVEGVKALIEKEREFWPPTIAVDYTGDQSKHVKTMLNDLQNNVLSAILLVVIVIIAILGARTALLVGIAIPGSFLTGILALAVLGYTVNMVVLFALIMAVGMLVDGAIVVTEYADREMSEGTPRYEAYKKASKRMAWPIIASTATTLAAFGPLLFWPGIMGEFMKFLPLTLIMTLVASLAMALIFVPTLGGLFGKPRPISAEKRQQLIEAEEGDIEHLPGFTGNYVRVLKAAVKRPWKVLFGALVFSLAVILLYGKAGNGTEFFPEVEPEGFNIVVRSQGDLSIEEKDHLIQEVERQLLNLPEVETLYARSGGDDRIGMLRVNLIDWQDRRPAAETIEEIKQRTAGLAGLEIEVRQDQAGPPTGDKDVNLQISSRFPALLKDSVAKVRKELESNPAFTNIDDTGPKPGIEWQIKVDRADAARFGADATLVGNNVQFVTTGLTLGEYRADDVDDEMDIRVRFPEQYRHITRLEELRLKTAQGQIPLSNFSTLEAANKLDTIKKVDGRQALSVTADMAPGYNLSKVIPEVMARLPELGLDPRVQITLRGENEEQEKASAFLSKAFLIAMAVMAIILVTQFNSFYQAFLILTAVLFSTVGVLLGMLVFNQPFGIVMSGIGIISLAGIVVNNNIVLIDTYNVLRNQGMEPIEAILRTGAQRLRPVMMTTVTTILGLMPMVLMVNVDLIQRKVEFGAPSTQMWAQLATAVAGGLAFATVLTLVITPCMLALGAHRQQRKEQKARSKSSPHLIDEALMDDDEEVKSLEKVS